MPRGILLSFRLGGELSQRVVAWWGVRSMSLRRISSAACRVLARVAMFSPLVDSLSPVIRKDIIEMLDDIDRAPGRIETHKYVTGDHTR
jgi:hypothetical protein